jgi:hypothetical protein
MNRRLHGFPAARVAAAAVRPKPRPEALRLRPLLNQQFAIAIEDQERERAVQDPATLMAAPLAQFAQASIVRIDQDEGIGIRVPNLIHQIHLEFSAKGS